MQTHPRTHSERAERDNGCCILYNAERRGFLRGSSIWVRRHEGICLGSQKLCGGKKSNCTYNQWWHPPSWCLTEHIVMCWRSRHRPDPPARSSLGHTNVGFNHPTSSSHIPTSAKWWRWDASCQWRTWCMKDGVNPQENDSYGKHRIT